MPSPFKTRSDDKSHPCLKLGCQRVEVIPHNLFPIENLELSSELELGGDPRVGLPVELLLPGVQRA
jgi:hypothetical protein